MRPPASRIVSLDIGGSHVTAAVIDSSTRNILPATRTRIETDESAASGVILEAWAQAALEAIATHSTGVVDRIGIAMPAPFDYARGVSLMEHKFAALYGLPVVELLAARFNGSALRGAAIVIANDADLFALGEWWAGAGKGRERIIGLTLGTGLGSGFIAHGHIVTSEPAAPAGGEMWNLPYLDGLAEDYVSGRAIATTYARASGCTLTASEIAHRARAGDAVAGDAFATMADHLTRILEPQIARFRPDCVVVGGNIARAWPLFGPRLQAALSPLECVLSARFEDAALLGAAALAQT
jgi:glucokinase